MFWLSDEAWGAIDGKDMGTLEKGTDEKNMDEERPGLWANIHARRKSGKRMRRKGEKGAPTEKQIKQAQGIDEEDKSVVDFTKKKEEKAVQKFSRDLSDKVKERMKAQGELVAKYKEDGKFNLELNDRFSTPHTRERNEPPYHVVGHFVDVPRKGDGPTKHGYYVQRKYGEGKDDYERHKIYAHDGNKDWSTGFQKIGALKSIKEDWQKVNRNDKTDGLSQKAVKAYRRENPGSKLKTAVTEKNPEGKRAKRRLSFCKRMGGMKKRLTSAETARDPDSRINKALRRWNCEE